MKRLPVAHAQDPRQLDDSRDVAGGILAGHLVAKLHGGTAAAHDRPGGRGVVVTGTLPLSPASPSSS